MSLGCRQAPPHTTCRTPVTPSLLSRTGRQAEPPPHAPLRRPVPCALGAAPPRLTSYKTLLPWRQLCPLLPCGPHTHRHQPLSKAILSSCPPPPARHRHPPRTATLPGVGVCVLSAPPKLLRPRVPGTTLPHPRNQRPQAPPGTRWLVTRHLQRGVEFPSHCHPPPCLLPPGLSSPTPWPCTATQGVLGLWTLGDMMQKGGAQRHRGCQATGPRAGWTLCPRAWALWGPCPAAHPHAGPAPDTLRAVTTQAGLPPHLPLDADTGGHPGVPAWPAPAPLPALFEGQGSVRAGSPTWAGQWGQKGQAPAP